MGCCNTRSKTSQPSNASLPSPPETLHKSRLALEASAQPCKDDSVPNSLVYTTDQTADDIEQYALDCIHESQTWLVLSQDFGLEIRERVVKLIQGSKFNAEVMTVCARVDFCKKIDPTDVLNAISDPNIRKTWDSLVLDVRSSAGSNSNSDMFYTRFRLGSAVELTEKRVFKTVQKEYRVVFYTPDASLEENAKELPQAYTYFGMYIIVQTAESTMMHLIYQTDYKVTPTLPPLKSGAWIKGLRNALTTNTN